MAGYTNKINIKLTHRVIENGCVWERLTRIDACWVSQSVFYEVLNTVSNDAFLKEDVIGNGEIMFHSAFKKGCWKGFFIRSERIDTSYCQVQDWKKCFYHQTCFSGSWNFNNKNNCAHVRLISFSYTIWFMIFEKKYHKGQVSSPWCMHTPQTSEWGIQKIFSALKLFLCGLVVFIDMNTCLQKEAGLSKHSWKKIIQFLWTVVSYLLKNVKYEVEHNINNTNGDIRHLWKLQQIW